MSDVTQADIDLSALVIRNSEVAHGAKLIATHRIAAEKAVLDRLLSETALEKTCKFIHAGYELESPNQRKLKRADLATAIADALETKR